MRSLSRSSRDPGLDALRAVAVLLVMGNHIPVVSPPEFGRALGFVTAALRSGGWVGVNLFFVLSGFLIGGLLFDEYQRRGRIDGLRFFIRRGFKIYPPYYALIGASALAMLAGAKFGYGWRGIGVDAVFLANYFDGTWPHLWSLSVEEHFYILAALVFPYWAARQSSDSPFVRLPLFVSLVGLACLVGRLAVHAANPLEWWLVYYPTQLQIDSLLIGVLLSWIRAWRPSAWNRLLSRRRSLLIAGMIPLSVPFVVAILDQGRYFPIGFTVGGIASALIVVGSVTQPGATVSGAVRALSSVGARSYALYLVHVPAAALVARFVEPETRWGTFVLAYLALTAISGVALHELVERPSLRLRDRLFPRLAG